MELTLLRTSSQDSFTTGLLLDDTGVREFLCETLEDEHREVKVAGVTRIPAGRYPIVLRTQGGMHARYSERFPDFHLGMLWLQGVPNFAWIYIHIGNTDEDTEGCILVGEGTTGQRKAGVLANSKMNYMRIYREIAERIESGEKVFINIIDCEGE
jgi:hypothetical protein